MGLFDFSQAGALRQRRSYQRFESSEDRPIPATVLDLLNRSKTLYRTWWFAHYALGLSGVIAGALLTAIAAPTASKQTPDLTIFNVNLAHYSWLIGIIAAVTTSLVTFLGPLHKAERYWSAYHILEQACLEYRVSDIDPKLVRLMTRVMEVRRILQVSDVGDRVAAATVKALQNDGKPTSS